MIIRPRPSKPFTLSRDSSPRFVRAAASLWFALLSGLLSSLGHTQDFRRDIPTHAHYSTAEQGWTCDDDFRQVASFCIRDTDIPRQNGVEVFDGQWRCLANYRRKNGICEPLTAPLHATLVGEGDRWECDWGFRRVGSRCEEISPPSHAYLDASGRDWVCYPGFERVADRCDPSPNAEPPGPGGTAGAAEESKPPPDPQGK